MSTSLRPDQTPAEPEDDGGGPAGTTRTRKASANKNYWAAQPGAAPSAVDSSSLGDAVSSETLPGCSQHMVASMLRAPSCCLAAATFCYLQCSKLLAQSLQDPASARLKGPLLPSCSACQGAVATKLQQVLRKQL